MLEILSPAGSPEALAAALNTGADAVYLGLHSFSARSNAKNFTDDELYEAARICRLSGVKVYLALNTLVYDDELPAVRRAVITAVNAGVDAIIVQDLGTLNIIKELTNDCEPRLSVHASTQMSITSVSGAQAAKKLGFTRVVLARELTLDEITEITRNADIETEVFVHGALCVSMSGQCMMSAFLGDGIRSANRGNCAQPCRLNFNAGGQDYALSLKDLSIIDRMSELEAAGVTSVKIEGRMKRPEYVAAATDACYKARQGQPYDRDVLRAVFSRNGFTDGWFTGNVSDMRGHRAKEDVQATADVLRRLRELYREPMKRRTISFSIEIRADRDIVCKAICDTAAVTLSFPPPNAAQNRATTAADITGQLSKLGGTVFTAGDIKCSIDNHLYISTSQINAIRRKTVQEISLILTNY